MNKNTDNSYKSIFRSSALHRHIKAREELVLPKFVSPHSILFLWFILLVLMSSALLTWLAELPIYASGMGLIQQKDETTDGQNEIVLVAFLPSESLSGLHIGQQTLVKFGAINGHLKGIITAVESDIMSPDVVRDRFGFDDKISPMTQPVAMVAIQLKPIPESTYLRSTYAVDVKIGSHRVLSLVPFIDRWLRD